VVRLGQNFLADPNLLDAIVRDSGVGEGDVVLEVGAGEGVLSERLAARVAHLHSVEIDPGLEPALAPIVALPNVTLHWGDAVRIDFREFDPVPDAMVANLPYSVATPVILKTIEELPSLRTWTVMVQLEIAERLRSPSGNKTYGAPSAIAQLACKVELLRKVDPAVFKPRPRVDSAILRLTRTGPGADAATRNLVRAAFAHRRKTLARSLEIAGLKGVPKPRAAAREALVELGFPDTARAEQLAPADFAALSAMLQRES
jgi:16S rRNA (adenine1518-N6/adenine1519-N6)-dimethyltransferase